MSKHPQSFCGVPSRINNCQIIYRHKVCRYRCKETTMMPLESKKANNLIIRWSKHLMPMTKQILTSIAWNAAYFELAIGSRQPGKLDISHIIAKFLQLYCGCSRINSIKLNSNLWWKIVEFTSYNLTSKQAFPHAPCPNLAALHTNN